MLPTGYTHERQIRDPESKTQSRPQGHTEDKQWYRGCKNACLLQPVNTRNHHHLPLTSSGNIPEVRFHEVPKSTAFHPMGQKTKRTKHPVSLKLLQPFRTLPVSPGVLSGPVRPLRLSYSSKTGHRDTRDGPSAPAAL